MCWRIHKRVGLAILLFLVLIYICVSFVDYAHYNGNRPWASKPKCYNSKDYTALLVRLANKTHVVLDSLGIHHWLIYGSLWGPLRGIPGPLPWDHDVDIGFNGDGNFSKIPLDEFKAAFEAAGLEVDDDTLKSTGSFLVGRHIGLIVFYDYRGTMMRTGYETWLFFINYRVYHSFPARLLQQPLPKVKFGSFNISVPRGGMEVMRYLYPFNWWKVVKPASCKTLN